MKCAACGYSDVPVDGGDSMTWVPYNRPPNGTKPFVKMLFAIPDNIDKDTGYFYWKEQTLYACPVCGTIKMEG